MSTDASSDDKAAPPATLEAFMVQALAMELEAAQRYAELADTMDVHNNREVTALFRKMSLIEGKHAVQIMDQMGWQARHAGSGAPNWPGWEAPETVPVDGVHYLMTPWHALQLALAAEQRAEAFFGHLASVAEAEPVRQAALALQQEEREHVELIQAWLKKVAKPAGDWADDPDPPRYDE